MKKEAGRPNLGLTKTLKERAIYVYVPTEEMAERWKTEAKKQGLSVSKLVVELVDDALRKNPRGLTPREQLEAELNDVWAKFTMLSSEVDRLREDKKRYEEIIAEYREKLATPGRVPEESAEYVPLLAELIQEGKVLPIQHALNMFGIGPGDTDAIRAIGAAADALVQMGLIEKGMSDWRWTGGASHKK